MLKYNFQRVFKLRGIIKPVGFLIRHGFSNSTASAIAGNKVKSLTTAQLGKLCVILKCTPNDFFEWIPESVLDNDELNPLMKLKREDIIDLNKITENFSLEKMEEIAKNLNTIK